MSTKKPEPKPEAFVDLDLAPELVKDLEPATTAESVRGGGRGGPVTNRSSDGGSGTI